MTTIALRAPAAAGFTGRIAALAERISAARTRRALYRQTVRELGALTNRELADLGIHRSMIRAIAQDAANAATV